MKHIRDLFYEFADMVVLVVGDLLMDHWVEVEAKKLSTESPMPVYEREEGWVTTLGGAGYVAKVVADLGAEVILRTPTTEGTPNVDSLMESSGVCWAPNRRAIFSNKTRYVAIQGGRKSTAFRVDSDVEARFSDEDMNLIGQTLKAGPDVILVADYGKGAITRDVLELLCSTPSPVIVDPYPTRDFGFYHGVNIIKLNRSELGQIVSYGEDISAKINHLEEGTGAMGVVTLDHEGIATIDRDIEDEDQLVVCPSKAEGVMDVTGAGDVVLATIGMAYAADDDTLGPNAFELSQHAAAMVVERYGCPGICRSRLLNRIIKGGVQFYFNVDSIRDELQRRHVQKLVMTNGCFDLLHAGHLETLRHASEMGEYLLVVVNSDESVRRIKGKDRPIQDLQTRIDNLQAVSYVDGVLVLEEDDPCEVIRDLLPDVLVKGGDYTEAEVVGSEIVREYGGLVSVGNHIPGISTTEIIQNGQR